MDIFDLPIPLGPVSAGIFFVAILIAVPVGLAVNFFERHDRAIEAAAVEAKQRKVENGYCFDGRDIKGNPICVVVLDADMQTVYTAHSGEYEAKAVDFNKSRMAGAFVKEKSAEFLKGFFGKKD